MSYIPVLLVMLVGLGIGCGALGVSALLGPRIWNSTKDSVYECGVPPVGDAKRRFSVHFYLVAILFLLFDVESVFFYPFSIVYKEFIELGPFILIEMGVFVAILLVGFYYVWRRGALEWD